jgi:RimJ/RimL family protein N-acetyltransferase
LPEVLILNTCQLLWSFEGAHEAHARARLKPGTELTSFGGHSGGGTPLPIPNREVKPVSADGTRRATSRESRSPPNYFSNTRCQTQSGSAALFRAEPGARSWREVSGLRAFLTGYDRLVELRTDGFTLRPWRADDAPAVTELCQDPEIARWIPVIPSPYTEADARAFLEHSRRSWELGEAYGFAIVDDAGDLLGAIGMRVLRFRTGHIGYWIAAPARGRGLATNALKALCRWAVEDLGLERLELVTDPQNAGSQRVAEKAGFRREGTLRSALEYQDGRRSDSIIFSLLPEELGSP